MWEGPLHGIAGKHTRIISRPRGRPLHVSWGNVAKKKKDHGSAKEPKKAQAAEKSHRKAAKLRRRIASGYSKKKCCRSTPRCKSCPTVIHRLRRRGALTLDDRDLLAAVKKARKW